MRVASDLQKDQARAHQGDTSEHEELDPHFLASKLKNSRWSDAGVGHHDFLVHTTQLYDVHVGVVAGERTCELDDGDQIAYQGCG
jgi:hypothetical protein